VISGSRPNRLFPAPFLSDAPLFNL